MNAFPDGRTDDLRPYRNISPAGPVWRWGIVCERFGPDENGLRKYDYEKPTVEEYEAVIAHYTGVRVLLESQKTPQHKSPKLQSCRTRRFLCAAAFYFVFPQQLRIRGALKTAE